MVECGKYVFREKEWAMGYDFNAFWKFSANLLLFQEFRSGVGPCM